MIGNASNVLVSDAGYRGAVVNLESALSVLRMEGDIVYVEAGVRTGKFVDFCIQRSLQGAEILAGLPGTVGGRVVMVGDSLAEHTVEVEVLRDNSIARLTKEEGFVYRKSGPGRDIVLAARFRFQDGDKEQLMRYRRELLVQRNELRPLNHPNAATIFKDPPGKTAAMLIEDAGLKGRVHGRAMVSDRHANLIVNNGGAEAKEVIELIKIVQHTVRAGFNVALELDVKLIGFEEQVLKEVA
jgi:UDP-N-acetylmuramate dehydrogenase